MQADNLLLRARNHKLEARRPLLLRVHHGVVQSREAGVVDLDVMVAELRAGVGFRQADGADFWVGEDDAGDVGVVELAGGELGGPEESVGEAAAGGDGDGGELDFPADVAERVDVFHVGVLVVVGDDLAALILFDACGDEAEVFDFRGAADGPEKAVQVERAAAGGAVCVVEGFPARFAGDGLDLGLGGVGVDVDALTLVLREDLVLDDGVKRSEELVVSDEKMGFAAEGIEHAGHFDGDVTRAYEGNFLGSGFELKKSVRGNA